ncbi:hypothetical protein BS78_04G234800 [Paspalum vaginatum]|nr:hypothetical protein BS78_04G234800 [Paspalum vaginatum]
MKKPNFYQSQVSILGPVGYGPTTLPLRHSDCCNHSAGVAPDTDQGN